MFSDDLYIEPSNISRSAVISGIEWDYRFIRKEYLNVLDFIGNYERAGRVRFLLTGKALSEKDPYNPADRSSFPDDCLIDFDMKLIDLFAEMDKKHLKIKDQIRNEYFRVKELIGKRPSRITNWKDLETGITYDKYCEISDKDHVKKILQMPVHFLQESGKGFFVKRGESARALREDLRDAIILSSFAEQMKDVIDYRTMDYYQRRYRERME